MTQMEIKQKIEELGRDTDFIGKLKACETAQQICDLYATVGVEITPEEIDAAIELINANNGDAEISVNELDSVSGGVFISGGAFLAYSAVYFCVVCQSSYVLGKANRK